MCLYSHSIPPEVSYHRQEVHRTHVSGYDYFSWLSTIFRSIKVHRNMWTFLQNHKQSRLNSSQTDSCSKQHTMESSCRLQVLIPDQAIKTPQVREAFSDDPIFLTLKPKEGFGAPSAPAIEQVNVAVFEVPSQSLTTFWANPNTGESIAGRVTFNKAYFAWTADLLKQTFCRNALFLLK